VKVQHYLDVAISYAYTCDSFTIHMQRYKVWPVVGTKENGMHPTGQLLRQWCQTVNEHSTRAKVEDLSGMKWRIQGAKLHNGCRMAGNGELKSCPDVCQ